MLYVDRPSTIESSESTHDPSAHPESVHHQLPEATIRTNSDQIGPNRTKSDNTADSSPVSTTHRAGDVSTTRHDIALPALVDVGEARRSQNDVEVVVVCGVCVVCVVGVCVWWVGGCGGGCGRSK